MESITRKYASRPALARRNTLMIFVLVLLIAAVARLPTLAWRSLDSDEGASLFISSLPYKELFRHFADVSLDRHPLLYYTLLKAWRQVVGDSDVLLRLPSALAGMVTVALVYQIGRRRLGVTAAAFAALLIAVNPLVIYQNQDARMYALGLLFSAMAICATWEVLDRPSHLLGLKLGILFISITLAAYSHFIAAMLFPALGLILVWEFARGRRSALWGLAVTVAGGVFYLPYVVNIIRSGSGASQAWTLDSWARTTLGAVNTLLDFHSTLAFPARYEILLALIGLIVVLAIWRGRGEGIVLAFWLLPLLALAIDITVRIGYFQTKIFVFSAIPLALLTALACFGRSRTFDRRGLIPALIVLNFTLYNLSFQWRTGAVKEDFRSAARFVQSQATANDSVIVHLSWTRWVFGHYFPGPFYHPFPNNVDASTLIEESMQPYLESEVLWLVQAGVGLAGTGGDPDLVVQRWLAERYPVVTEVFPGGIDVRGYATRFRLPSLPESATALNVTYPRGLRLVGYRIAQTELPSRDLWLHPPSTWVPVTLYWSVDKPLESDVRLEIVLEDEPGNVWGGAISRESDVRAFHTPIAWQPKEIVRWDFDINTNPQVPPNDYKVVLRVYDAENGVPLVNEGGNDWTILDRVQLR